MTKGIDNTRNKPKDTANINTLINARNCFEEMLNCKYHTDVVETMIYDKALSIYRESDIVGGGDINEANRNMIF